VVVADSEHEAKLACGKIKVEYEPLPVINSPLEAFQKNATLIHEDLWKYTHAVQDKPEDFTNIANLTKVRKGNIKRGLEESEVIIENRFSFPQSDHVATETRAVLAEINPNGEVIITTSSQAPYTVQKLINRAFSVNMEKIKVITPFVGGAFGGKASIQLEFIAYVASQAVGGRLVKLVNSREEDILSSPVKIGLEAEIKLGCRKDGRLTAVQITYWFDAGTYSGEAPHVTKSAALNCTGPSKNE
jgi:CO/xanthine dehydrogenase Mo-binding subunit